MYLNISNKQKGRLFYKAAFIKYDSIKMNITCPEEAA